ncbi:MAG: hypothetical protein LH630_09555, partial [Actinomycetia bacterium]|nr:hypothetical protein [Actinomycetes bacterium]
DQSYWLPSYFCPPLGMGRPPVVSLPVGPFAVDVPADDASSKTDPARPFVLFSVSCPTDMPCTSAE